jgi:hypothetical protein
MKVEVYFLNLWSGKRLNKKEINTKDGKGEKP